MPVEYSEEFFDYAHDKDFIDSWATHIDTWNASRESAELEIKELREALQYLVDTKKRKDTIGADAIYAMRKTTGWAKAERLLKGSK